MNLRTGTIERQTRETRISVNVNLDGEGRAAVRSGLGFLDHMLAALALHSRIDIDLTCDGDVHVDDHHSVEDCAIALGQAIHSALGDRMGIARFGWAIVPMDESLARAVIDLSGRSCAVVNLGLKREQLGDVACENLTHFFVSLAAHLRATVHIDVERGENDHHRAEAAFKVLALALKAAVKPSADSLHTIASTKGTLS